MHAKKAGKLQICRLLLLITVCLSISACKALYNDSPEQAAKNESMHKGSTSAPYLRLDAVLMGDPDGKIDTYFSDNSVATEAVEFSLDDAYFASVSKSKNSSARLILWDSKTKSKRWEQSLSGETECLAFSQAGDFIVVGGETAKGSGNLQVFDAQSGTAIERDFAIHYEKSIEGMRFSPNGKMLATGDEAGNVVIWDTRSASPDDWFIVARHSVKNEPEALADVNQIDWTSDSQFIVTAERDGDVDMYRANDLITQFAPKPYRRFLGFEGNTVKSVRVSADGRYVAAGAGGTQGVRLWHLGTAELVRHIASESGPNHNTGKILNAERYESVAFSPDSSYLLVGGTWPSWWFAANGQENKGYKVPIAIFPLQALTELAREQQISEVQHFDSWRSEYFDFNSQGTQFVSGHDDGSIRLWSVKTPPQ